MPNPTADDPRIGGEAAVWPHALLGAAFALVMNLPAVFYPAGRDQGIFAYNAWLLLEGGIPGIDFVDQKPPGILFLYASAMLAGGRSMTAVHLLEWFWIGMSSLAAAWLGGSWGGAGVGFLSAVTVGFFLSPALCGFWTRAQTESFLVLPYALILILLSTPRHRRRAAAPLLAGLLGGLCFCLKPNAAAFPMLAGLVLPWIMRRRAGSSPTSAVRASAAYLAGLVLPPFALFVWLWVRGALGAFLDHLVSVNSVYIGSGGVEVLARFAWVNSPTLLFSAAGAFVLWVLAKRGPAPLAGSLRRILGGPAGRPVRIAWLLSLWLGGLAMLLSGRFLFPYHYQVLVLPSALTVSIVAAALIGAVRQASGRAGLHALAALLLVAAVAMMLPPEDRSFLTGKTSLEEYHMSGRFDHYDFSYAEDRRLGRALETILDPGERAQIFGHGSLALFLAGRRAATRFPHTPAAMDPRFGRAGRDRREILETLTQSPPPVIVITRNDPLPQFDVPPSDHQIRAFPELSAFIADNYVLSGEIGDHLLFRRSGRMAQ